MPSVIPRTSTNVNTHQDVDRSTLVLPMTEEEIIQINVKKFREAMGMSQEELAHEAGVTIDAVRSWDQKKRTPERPSMSRLAKVFGLRLDDFSSEDPPMPEPVPRVSVKIRGHVGPEFEAEVNNFVVNINRRILAAHRAETEERKIIRPGEQHFNAPASPPPAKRRGKVSGPETSGRGRSSSASPRAPAQPASPPAQPPTKNPTK